MIAKHDTIDRNGIWERIAAPLPPHAIEWRQDGRPTQRDGKFYARFIAYVTAQYVRERLDTIVPGEWDLTCEILPPMSQFLAGEIPDDAVIAVKARIQILGVIREDVGQGRDFKAAATDAFKRAAMRFGIAHELYALDVNWVQVDGDGKFAKPLEDPGAAYARRYGTDTTRFTPADVTAAQIEGEQRRPPQSAGATASTATASPASSAGTSEPSCPKCGGRMWDNRATKRNAKAPDYKCRDRSCDGVVWPPKGEKAMTQQQVNDALDMEPVPYTDDLPF